MTDTVRVVFTPSGRSGSVPAGTTVLDAARALGVDVDSVCGGRGVCGRCQVRPAEGSFAKWGIDCGPGSLSAPGATEADYTGRRPLAEGRRLGCAARCWPTRSSTCPSRARCTDPWCARPST